jgi:hypothetical protein
MTMELDRLLGHIIVRHELGSLIRSDDILHEVHKEGASASHAEVVQVLDSHARRGYLKRLPDNEQPMNSKPDGGVLYRVTARWGRAIEPPKR